MKRMLPLMVFLLVQGGWAADWTWQDVGPEGGAMMAVSVNPADSSVISASSFCDGYLNQGGPWQRVLPQGPSGGGSDCIFLLPDTALFIEKESGELFQSADGGLNWTYVRAFSDEVLGSSEVKSRLAYIVAEDWTNAVDSLYRTADAGATWGTLGVLPVYFQENVAITSYLDTLIFIGGWAQDSIFVLKSDDGGLSWNTVVGFSSPGEGEVYDLEWDQSTRTLWTCFDPGPPHAASLPPVHLYNDSLGATAFLDELKNAQLYLVTDVEFSTGDTLFGCGLLGIYRLVKTNQWDSVWVDAQVDSSAVVSDIDIEGSMVWAASDVGCLVSTDGGNSWQYQNDGLNAVLIFSHSQLSELADRTLYTGSIGRLTFGPLYKSTDEGATWQWLQQGPKLAGSAELHLADPDVAYLQGLWLTSGYNYHSIARSLDGGLSWAWMNTFPPDSVMQEMNMSDLWVSPSNQDVLLRVRGATWQLYPGPILRSTNGGATWYEALPMDVLSLAGRDTVFASWDSTWVSYNAGSGWGVFSEIGGWIDWDELNQYLYLLAKGPPLNLYRYDLAGDSAHVFGPFTCAAIIPDLSVSPQGHVYISWLDPTWVPQIARSTDLGATWEIDTLDFLCGLVKACSTAVLASEIGRGLKRSTDIVGVAETKVTAAQRLSFAASPTPFIGSTTIKYSLPEKKKVRVAVYDVLGRLTRVVEQGKRDTGTHWVRWDGASASGTQAPSGVYFIRIETENCGAATVSSVKLSR